MYLNRSDALISSRLPMSGFDIMQVSDPWIEVSLWIGAQASMAPSPSMNNVGASA
jgi:hypothetical protein